ncbi:unnamed protein product [Heligmosomoides polygyrus]|uniref:CBFD_NFYB_HMF domain-containing protein n=1 Tax=Heligmosomoides polygyrus TaxID=6339 RepID=A0A183FN45_HELPZ|nr:unnamed protein product [Heligmosomoides polygyrus]
MPSGPGAVPGFTLLMVQQAVANYLESQLKTCRLATVDQETPVIKPEDADYFAINPTNNQNNKPQQGGTEAACEMATGGGTGGGGGAP